MSERNPYLVLGIDYGSILGEAKRAFARAARDLKRGTARKSFERSDLSWALNEIEHEITNPEAHTDYLRVPADAELYELRGSGLLNPDPYLPDRLTHAPVSAASSEMIEVSPLTDVINDALLEAFDAGVSLGPYPMLEEERT